MDWVEAVQLAKPAVESSSGNPGLPANFDLTQVLDDCQDHEEKISVF